MAKSSAVKAEPLVFLLASADPGSAAKHVRRLASRLVEMGKNATAMAALQLVTSSQAQHHGSHRVCDVGPLV